MATYFEKIGENIRKARKKTGISQENLAELSKVDTKSIVQIELGKRNPTIKTIRKIALALKSTASKLLK